MATTSTESSRIPASYSNFVPKPTLAQRNSDGFAAGFSFRNINVCGYTKSTDYQRTVGNFPFLILRNVTALLGLSRKTKVDILKGCDGIVQRGEMLLVLGRPGSGCTTFLKAIAGEMYGLCIDDVSKLNYQGVNSNTMHSMFRGECSYLAELDIHFPTLTVSETLDVAARARPQRGTNAGQQNENRVRQQYKEILTSLRLSHILNTRVGNDFLPGISGGERKRLSIAEILIGGTSLQCWDNSTRGLDSSNALTFVETLRLNTREHHSTAILSLYQSSQKIYEMFDKVLLLYEGRQVYFGSMGTAKAYFDRLGFVCPERMTTSDFLTSVTNPSLRAVKPMCRSFTPETAEDFARVWRNSPEYEQVLQDIRDFDCKYPLDERRWKWKLLRNVPYKTPIHAQVWTCIIRGVLRLKNDLAPPVSGILGNCVLSTILGSVFYNLPETTDTFFERAALLFFTILLNAFASAFEPGMLWEQRPIVEKHYRYAFFYPFADAIAAMICDLPNKILTSIFFNIPVYFLSHLRRDAGAFFVFWLFSFTCLLTMSMIFRTIGSMSSTLAGSMAPAAVFMLMLMMYTGFTLPVPYMHPWFRWFHYLNPVGYAFESLMINEFHDRDFYCSQFVPEGADYKDSPLESRICSVTSAVAGELTANGDTYIKVTYGYDVTHLWRNFAILIAIMAFGCLTHLVATEYMSIKKSKGDVLLFRQNARRVAGRYHHEEVRAAQKPLGASSQHPSSVNRSPGLSYVKEDVATSWRPTPPVLWNNLGFDISLKNDTRRLLNDLEGWVKPGTTTALMGISGAGKTTLLNVLANRATTGVVHGDIIFEASSTHHAFTQRIGYAQQQDVHLSTSTVREALEFSALLRQPTQYSRNEKLTYVEEVIDMLDMAHFADAVIGVPGEGLNAGQRKRLTIGVELAARPELLLFLDEPTSGLDSDTAWAICVLLRRLADQGQSILCTMHQPSAALFQMFDRLLVLTEGGQSIYFGDIGARSSAVIDYFENHGARFCNPHENPAEWLMEVTSQSYTEDNNIDWARTWQNSDMRRQAKDHIMQMKDLLTDSRPEGVALPTIRQLEMTTIRLFRHYWRSPSYVYSKALLCTLTALFISFSFWKSENSIQGLQNQIFAIFLLLTVFTNLDQQIISQYVGYRKIYESQEAKSATYSWPVFLLSNILVEIPWQTLMSAVLFVCWYYPIGMFRNGNPEDSIERGGLVFMTIWSFMLFTLTGSFAIVAGMDSGPTAVNIAQLLYSLSLIFCGVLVAPGSLPNFWKFMYHVSPVTYFTAALIAGALGDASIVCSSDEILRFPAPKPLTCGDYMQSYIDSHGGYLLDPGSISQCQFCAYTDAHTILQNIGIKYSDRWRDLGFTLVYSVFNVGVTMLLYWLFRVPKRKKEHLQPR